MEGQSVQKPMQKIAGQSDITAWNLCRSWVIEMRRIASSGKPAGSPSSTPSGSESIKTLSKSAIEPTIAAVDPSAEQVAQSGPQSAIPTNSVMEVKLREQSLRGLDDLNRRPSHRALQTGRRGSDFSSSDQSSMSLSHSDSSNTPLCMASEVTRRRRSSGTQGAYLRSAAVRTIKKMAAQSMHLNLSDIEKEISKTFVLDRHLKAIGVMAQKFKFAVSIRESGASTLRCLALGAAAKGHDILEKTIKESSIQSAYPGRASEIMERLIRAQVDGYVGHWDPNSGRLLGIYVGPEAQDATNNPDLAANLKKTPDGKNYFPIDLEHLEVSLQSLKAAENWQAIPFTGDYDLHDLLRFGTHNGPVTQGSEEELKLLTNLNSAIEAIDPDSRPNDSKHKNVVQHGPQYNFVAHMNAEERVHLLVGTVAKPSFPLAMCDRGEWSIVENLSQLKAFYSDRGMNLKSSWADSDDYFESRGDGYVTSRRASTDSWISSVLSGLSADAEHSGDECDAGSEHQAKPRSSG